MPFAAHRCVAAALAIIVAAHGAPCDIFAAGGTPCVAAHSVVRALYSSFNGALYQVNRTADGALLDIKVLSPGGFADAAAQDAFCGSALGSPALPPLNTTVNISPLASPALSFRHCDAQGFVTRTDGDADHEFVIVAALDGTADAVSFRSVNFPEWFVAPVSTAEPGRLGVVRAPAPLDASWTATPAAGSGVTLSLRSRGGAMAVGSNLTGSCAANYAPPAASVYLEGDAARATVWRVAPATPGPPPPRCAIAAVYDQSPRGNHLTVAPAGGAVNRPDSPVDAEGLRVSVGGHAVWAAYFQGGQGYRRDATSGVATGNEEETLFMVTSGTVFNAGCCFVRRGCCV